METLHSSLKLIHVVRLLKPGHLQCRRKLANQNVHCEHLTVRFLVTASSKGQFDLSIIDSSALYRFSHNYKSCVKIYLENSWLSFVVKYMWLSDLVDFISSGPALGWHGSEKNCSLMLITHSFFLRNLGFWQLFHYWRSVCLQKNLSFDVEEGFMKTTGLIFTNCLTSLQLFFYILDQQVCQLNKI